MKVVAAAAGIAAGLFVSRMPAGPLPDLAQQASQGLAGLVSEGLAWGMSSLGEVQEAVPVRDVLAPCLVVMAPGIAACALALLCSAVGMLRKVIAALLVAAGLASFAFLEPGQAVLLLLACVALAIFSSLASGLLLQVPLIALGTVLAASFLPALLDGSNPLVAQSTGQLVAASGMDVPELWQVVLLCLAAFPFLAALGAFLRSGSPAR